MPFDHHKALDPNIADPGAELTEFYRKHPEAAKKFVDTDVNFISFGKKEEEPPAPAPTQPS